jgi:hypothetical protein
LKAVSTITSLYFGKTGTATKIINYEEEYNRISLKARTNVDSFMSILGSVSSSQKYTNMFMVNLKPIVNSGFIGENIKTQFDGAYKAIEETEKMCNTFTSEISKWRE